MRVTTNEKGEQIQNENAAAVEEQLANILKLNDDCFEATLDYSPLEDVISIGKTCKRLQQVAGYRFSRNYSAIWIECQPNRFKVFEMKSEKMVVTHFTESICKIVVKQERGLQHFLHAQPKLCSLKQIEIRDIDIAQFDVNGMITILNKSRCWDSASNGMKRNYLAKMGE